MWLRLLLLSGLVASSLATFHCLRGGRRYHLIDHIRLRYPGISDGVACDLTDLVVRQPPRLYLPHIKLPGLRHGLPVPLGLQDRYLRLLFGLFPPVSYHPYVGGLLSYLHGHGFKGLTRGRLVDHLALGDLKLCCNLVYPQSSIYFNRFFAHRLLGLPHKIIRPVLPSVRIVVRRLPRIILRPIPPGFSPISLPHLPGITDLVHLPRKIGLPRFIYPAFSLAGLKTYVGHHNIPWNRYLGGIRGLKTTCHQYRKGFAFPKAPHFLPPHLWSHDLLGLLCLRYYGFPSVIRSRIRFPALAVPYARGYIRRYRKRKHKYPRFGRRLVTHFLGGFDKYTHKYLKRHFKGGHYCRKKRHCLWDRKFYG